MKPPLGAIKDVDEMHAVFASGIRTLWIGPLGSGNDLVCRFEIINPTITKESGGWLIAEARNVSPEWNHHFDAGVTCFYDGLGTEWYWFTNFWFAYAYVQRLQEEKK